MSAQPDEHTPPGTKVVKPPWAGGATSAFTTTLLLTGGAQLAPREGQHPLGWGFWAGTAHPPLPRAVGALWSRHGTIPEHRQGKGAGWNCDMETIIIPRGSIVPNLHLHLDLQQSTVRTPVQTHGSALKPECCSK